MKNESSKADELPLKPSLTPAMGVGGFILIALGAVLALIGSRNLRYFLAFYYALLCTHPFTYHERNRIQVFLSTGFLASLGVTVSHSPFNYRIPSQP